LTLAGESPNRPAPPRGLWSQVAVALAFVLGCAAFAVVNTVLVVLANPTLPNPGPQSDVRLEISIVAGVVLAIVLLLGALVGASGQVLEPGS
jgi:hypothetical protein